MAYKMIQVGTGGFGGAWCLRFLPPNVADGLIEVVAAVDVDPAHLTSAQPHLGLPAEKCYTDIHRAFDENPADFCTVVVPPAHHESVVDVASPTAATSFRKSRSRTRWKPRAASRRRSGAPAGKWASR